MSRGHLPRIVLGLAAALLISGCGGEEAASDRPAARATTGGTVDGGTNVCVADATEASSPYGRDFPDDWPFPDGAVVSGVEDRGDGGTIVTAVAPSPFHEVLDFMNSEVVGAGFTTESGETEDDDAEAEWSGNGYRGRWAIRRSTCSDETVIQVLAAPGED